VRVLYDGSFEGFLSLVHEVYYDKLSPTIILKKPPQTLHFEPLHECFTQSDKAQKVLLAVQKHFSPPHFTRIFHTFLCDTEAFEMALLFYITQGFKEKKMLDNITLEPIFYLQHLEHALLRLSHKMYGFTRFEELEDGTLYAKIKTKYNVLPFLGKHFAKRLGSHPFIIHDLGRSLAFIKDDHHTQIHTVSAFDTPTLSRNEEEVQALWKTFFHHVAIENRRNPHLQKSLVPLLYRTYMTEFLA